MKLILIIIIGWSLLVLLTTIAKATPIDNSKYINMRLEMKLIGVKDKIAYFGDNFLMCAAKPDGTLVCDFKLDKEFLNKELAKDSTRRIQMIEESTFTAITAIILIYMTAIPITIAFYFTPIHTLKCKEGFTYKCIDNVCILDGKICKEDLDG